MSFLETSRFPDDISYGGTGGPMFQTSIGMVDSGTEYRNQDWSLARARYDVGHAARVKASYDALLAFFYAARGRANGFRYKDWADFEATASQGVYAVIDSTHSQMYKRYTFGSYTYDRKIVKPYGTITVTGGTGPTTDSTTGIVTFTGAAPTAWSGQFDVPCRFDTDTMDGTMIARSGGSLVGGWTSIPIVEIRL